MRAPSQVASSGRGLGPASWLGVRATRPAVDSRALEPLACSRCVGWGWVEPRCRGFAVCKQASVPAPPWLWGGAPLAAGGSAASSVIWELRGVLKQASSSRGGAGTIVAVKPKTREQIRTTQNVSVS